MRFVCLHHNDLFSEKVWSGIPLNIMEALKADGHEVVTVCNLQPSTTLIGRIKGVLYKKLFKKIYLVNRDPHTFARRAADANRRIRDAGHADAIIATQIGDAAFIQTDAPIITVHDSTWYQLLDYYPGYERAGYAAETVTGGITLDKLGLQHAQHCVFNSRWAAESAHRDYGIPLDKLTVVPLGANLPATPSDREHLAFLEKRGVGTCKFLFLGKEWHRKGGDIAVAILTELERRGLPVKLHVVGCTQEGPVPAFVRQHGTLWKKDPAQAEQLIELLEQSDFFILPTRAECFGMVFCEAAAYGLPVITTDTGGVAEVVAPEWGITLPPSTAPTEYADQYADWILQTFQDRELYAQRSHAAREDLKHRLTWKVMCNHLAEVAARLNAERHAIPALPHAASPSTLPQ